MSQFLRARGTSVATDDIAGVHYQKIKLIVGAADEAVMIDNGQQTMVNSIPVVLASDQSYTAVSRTTDHIGAALHTDAIMNALVTLTPKFAVIAASATGNNTLVAAVTGKKIRVLAYSFMGAGAVNAKFQSGATGTDLTGLKYVAAVGGGICAPFNPVGWFETASAVLLNLNLSAAVMVGGELVYVEV